MLRFARKGVNAWVSFPEIYFLHTYDIAFALKRCNYSFVPCIIALSPKVEREDLDDGGSLSHVA